MVLGKTYFNHSLRRTSGNTRNESTTQEKGNANHRILIGLISTFLFISCGTTRKVVVRQNPPKETKEVIQEKTVPTAKPVLSEKKMTNTERINLYIAKFGPIAQKEMEDYGIPASITLAQGILESGMGVGRLAVEANNHFGIKCHKDWKGDSIYHDDDEKGECFRVYDQAEISYRDHSLFLTQRERYAFLFQLNEKNYKAWAKGLKKAGYATDPEYPEKLISLIERFQLDRFDHVGKRNKTAIKTLSNEKTTQTAQVHKVEKGDTLYSISKRYNVDVEVLIRENAIENNTIFLGQTLTIPNL